MIAKRLFDLLVTLLALVGFSPVIIYVYLKVKKEFGLPVIFSQQRPGLGGKPFKLVKFRTMLNAKGSDDKPLSDDERLTLFGRKLRSSSQSKLDVTTCGPVLPDGRR